MISPTCFLYYQTIFQKFEPQVTKELAKGMAEFSNGAVFVAFSTSCSASSQQLHNRFAKNKSSKQ